jgi:transposase
MGVSRTTAYKWWHRYVLEGEAGLHDRSSRPLRSPRRTPAEVERQVQALRRRTKLGPVRIGEPPRVS